MKLFFTLTFSLLLLATQAQLQYPPVLMRTTGKLPAFTYGLGEDRLGGARMGYIDSNVLLRVVDSVKDMYHVQLSKQHTVYIDKIFCKPDSAQKWKPAYLSGTIVAKGDTLYDNVSISLEEKLPYRSWMEINPNRIVVEVFGVQSNTNWITQLQTLKEVKNVYYQQVEDDVFRVIIELQHKQHWGYTLTYKGNRLQVHVKRQPVKPDLRNLTILIDAGHGGTNAGTGGIKAPYEEKYYTLLFAKALQKQLNLRGVKKIIMTRTADTTFDNKDRILFAQQNNPDLVISLHLNSSSNAEVKGVSTYYKHIGFRPLTQSLLRRMLELKLEEFGNVGSFNFMLNQPTDFINSLVEIAFLSNASDEKRIMKTQFQQDVAKKITLGIIDWLKSIQ